ncbi:MAG: MFS transporter [Promethearchaeota archaeon]
MIRTRRLPRIFAGWWMNLVTGITSGLGHGFYGYGMSVLFKPIASDLGLSRAATSVATGIGRLQGGVEAPITGWLSDRFGPRWVIVVGICFVGTGLVLMNFINSPWTYYLVWGVVIAIGTNLGLTIAVDKALTDWFIRKRGLALGVRFVIIGICGVIVLPIISWLVTTQGWRITCLIWAGVMFTGVPFSWFFVKQKRPEYYGLLPDGVSTEPGSKADIDTMIVRGVDYAASLGETEFTLREAMRTRAYWLIVISWICYTMVMGAFNIHCIPFLTDMGIDPTVAGSMMAMMAFFAVPARFLGGFLADRVRKDRLQFLVAGAFLLQSIGITAFLLNQSIAMAYVLLILYGFGSGAPTPMRLTIGGRYFGRKAFASIQGTSMMFGAPVSFLAPVYAGWVYDTTGSYTTAFVLFAALAALAASLMCLVRPPKPPAQITDIRTFM